MQNFSENFFVKLYFVIFGFLSIDLGRVAKVVLSKSHVFHISFEFEVLTERTSNSASNHVISDYSSRV